jgi:TonB family protein
MKKEVKEDIFIRQPVYPGGNNALTTYLVSNIQYPKDAITDKIEGVVELRIYIDHQGLVNEAKILNSLSPSCDEEAIRLAKTVKFIIPKNPRNLKVTFQKILRIQFKLPIEKPKPATPQIQKIVYHTSSNTLIKVANQTPQTVYSYQVKIK